MGCVICVFMVQLIKFCGTQQPVTSKLSNSKTSDMTIMPTTQNTNKKPTTVILHIGPHKTGTTSFQSIMHSHRAAFLEAGIDPLRLEVMKNYLSARHGDIARAVIRPEMLEPGMGLHKGNVGQQELRANLQDEIHKYVNNSESNSILISSETLYLLRTEEELSCLKELFPKQCREFIVIAVRRDYEDWKRSFENQFTKTKTPLSSNRKAFSYVEADSWLWQLQETLDLYGKFVGSVKILEYDRADIIKVICDELGVKIDGNTSAFKRNRSVQNSSLGRIKWYLLKRLFGNEDQGLRGIYLRTKENIMSRF